MDRAAFWAVIDEARSAGPGDVERAAALVDVLARRGADEVREFAEIQARLMAESYSWPLWGAAYIINAGCSDDGFDYFRGWLLLRGRDTWESALRDPETLVRAEPPAGVAECEDVLYAAAVAHERVTGQADLEVPRLQPNEPTGPRWNEEDLQVRFPALWTRYGEGRPASPSAEDQAAEILSQAEMQLGMSFLSRRLYDDALPRFTRVREIAPRPVTAALATNNLAWTRLLMGGADDVAAALPLAEDAARRMRQSGTDTLQYVDAVTGTLAFALIANGRDVEGVALVEPLLERTPPGTIRSLRQCVLAIGAAHLGRTDQAQQLVAEVVATEPDCVLLERANAALGHRLLGREDDPEE